MSLSKIQGYLFFSHLEFFTNLYIEFSEKRDKQRFPLVYKYKFVPFTYTD
ncbi:hypothetical protein QI0055_2213 [Listeria monocytogenes]|nr:hypothetical protein QI0055_2213 [Listeria monocytogenes]CAE6424942.1 hypothetical protein QI0054_2211 [Listeria monocytogenes]CUK65223.1 hypothetical protein LM600581_70288 [Listeria monocytogenes]CUK69735.1 hypothetical protein LM601023_210003 [Listeria monocytogenes]CUM00000.1 hypothetical protein LM900372_60285 [Listeria monocytogenes]